MACPGLGSAAKIAKMLYAAHQHDMASTKTDRKKKARGMLVSLVETAVTA